MKHKAKTARARNQVNAVLDAETMRWLLEKSAREHRRPAQVARIAIEEMRDRERPKRAA